MQTWSAIANKGTSNVQTTLALTAAAASPSRAQIAEWILGAGVATTPNATAAWTFIAQRCTTAGTGAAVTPQATDPADTLASTFVAKQTITADPTLTAGAILLWIPLNQNATFRWVANPQYELVIPATASNGFGFGVSAATATSFDMTVMWRGQ